MLLEALFVAAQVASEPKPTTDITGYGSGVMIQPILNPLGPRLMIASDGIVRLVDEKGETVAAGFCDPRNIMIFTNKTPRHIYIPVEGKPGCLLAIKPGRKTEEAFAAAMVFVLTSAKGMIWPEASPFASAR